MAENWPDNHAETLMIKTIEQAKKIQGRRFVSGLRGHSKAVRRFIKSQFPEDYQKIKGNLPANW